ncbi:MAG: CO dehydrogenase/acetyl-CoA synthase complex subunit epsilon [Candidatus Hydrothermarchaeota archaeon]|jgi:CO dehydrogenase/acetyl-CoA synthase complex epsilon subunit|nr:CO dehydrogenase/acetyl-CoA synthase complex subunit epsilon [Candidatus Hydrothermarchaeota archaeon]
MRITSWVKTHHAGSYQARPVVSDEAMRIIRKAEKPAIIIGARIMDLEGAPLERTIRLAKALNMPIVATAHSGKFLAEQGFTNYVEMAVVEITNVATDEEWQGIEGYGRPDLVIVLGAHLDLMNATFQSLKNFSDIPTLSISRYFMANATYSFPNLDDEIWLQCLDELCEKVENTP